MASLSYWYARKRYYQGQIDQASRKKAQYASQIEALEHAYNRISTLKQDFNDLKDAGSERQVKPDWKGTNYDQCMDIVNGSLKNSFSDYYRTVDIVHDRIRDKITQLKNEIDSQDSFIGTCRSWLRSIGNEIAKLLN